MWLNRLALGYLRITHYWKGVQHIQGTDVVVLVSVLAFVFRDVLPWVLVKALWKRAYAPSIKQGGSGRVLAVAALICQSLVTLLVVLTYGVWSLGPNA